MGRAQQDCSTLTAGCAQSGQEPQGCTPSAYSTKGKPKALSLGRAHPASTAQPDCATRLQKAKTPTRTLGAPHTAAVPPRTGSAAPHTSGSWFRTAAVGRGARGSAPPACSGSVRRRQREAPDPTEPRALPHRPPRGLPPPCIPGAGRSRGLPHRRPGGGKRKRWGAAAELEATGPGAARATLTMAARRGCAGRWQRRRLPVRSAPLSLLPRQAAALSLPPLLRSELPGQRRAALPSRRSPTNQSAARRPSPSMERCAHTGRERWTEGTIASSGAGGAVRGATNVSAGVGKAETGRSAANQVKGRGLRERAGALLSWLRPDCPNA